MNDKPTFPIFPDGDTTGVQETPFPAINDVPVVVSVQLGRAVMTVAQIMKLGRGAVIELEKKIGEPMDLFINDRLVARGELALQNEKLSITLTEIIKSDQNKH